MQWASAMYSCFIRSWLQSSYNIKKAIWISFHYTISCYCLSSLAFDTVVPNSSHMWKGSMTQTWWFFWGGWWIFLEGWSLFSIIHFPKGLLVSLSWHDEICVRLKKLHYLVFPGYIPNTYQLREEKHACISGHMGRKSMGVLAYDLWTVRRRHSCQGKE